MQITFDGKKWIEENKRKREPLLYFYKPCAAEAGDMYKDVSGEYVYDGETWHQLIEPTDTNSTTDSAEEAYKRAMSIV